MNRPAFTGNDDESVVAIVPNTLAVYRNLRIGLAVTAVMLASSIVIQSLYMPQHSTEHCWQGALSEYFYTSTHSIFIAALLGLATLFFVYRGSSDTEDALLTLAGVAALIKAVKPKDLERVIVDSTVQEKAIAHPVDSRLLEIATLCV